MDVERFYIKFAVDVVEVLKTFYKCDCPFEEGLMWGQEGLQYPRIDNALVVCLGRHKCEGLTPS